MKTSLESRIISTPEEVVRIAQEVIRRSGRTQTEIAASLGISQAAISRLIAECGDRFVDLAMWVIRDIGGCRIQPLWEFESLEEE